MRLDIDIIKRLLFRAPKGIATSTESSCACLITRKGQSDGEVKKFLCALLMTIDASHAFSMCKVHFLVINTVLYNMSIHTSLGQINYHASFITVGYRSHRKRAYVVPEGKTR